MIRKYIQKAMESAHYELLSDDGSFYGEIPECSGVYANAKTLEVCRQELEAVLEEWILLRLHRNLQIPEIDGVAIKVSQEVVA